MNQQGKRRRLWKPPPLKIPPKNEICAETAWQLGYATTYNPMSCAGGTIIYQPWWLGGAPRLYIYSQPMVTTAYVSIENG